MARDDEATRPAASWLPASGGSDPNDLGMITDMQDQQQEPAPFLDTSPLLPPNVVEFVRDLQERVAEVLARRDKGAVTAHVMAEIERTEGA